MSKLPWGFYGRRREVGQILEILRRGRWFFLKISGRRRIGKTSLVQEALREIGRERAVYLQIPDSDPAGVLSTVRDFYATFGLENRTPRDLGAFAASIAGLVRDGFVVVIDEFQYFHRQSLAEFTSHLQYEVDRLAKEADRVPGGLIVLGSIHTEMAALLEDRTAPLFNRLTDQMELPHLDIASILEILQTHADDAPERLLFLWNLFEGVPKFYRDCYEQEVLDADRPELLRKMFFTSSSPLRTEAESWFLRELRGRYDLILKYVARHPGCTHSELDAHVKSSLSGDGKQVAGYIKVLRERYGMIERLQPVFAKPTARNGRFYLKDNFLRTWLSVLAVPTASVNFRPLEPLLAEADQQLAEAEGYGFEMLIRTLYEERSRKGIGDFELTSQIHGYWDKAGTEIDLVALNDETKIVRFGSCKRNADRLVGGLKRFDGHVERFLRLKPELSDWKVEKTAIAPRLSTEARRAAKEAGYITQDLADLTVGL